MNALLDLLRTWWAGTVAWWRMAVYPGLLVLGFCGGWAARRPQPVPLLVVGHTQPQPARDLSPSPEVRTVVLAAVRPGPALPPPAPVPADLGVHVATTSTALPALPVGGLFRAATFARLEGPRLSLRTVEWLDTPTGREPLGLSETMEQVTALDLPPAPPVPRWSVSLLAAPQGGRVALGGLVQRSWGPVVVSAGHVGDVAFAGGGVRW